MGIATVFINKFAFAAGVLLGKSVWIDGININQITHAENVSPTPQKLAVSLLLALFPHEELASGNCTTPKRADINLLDQSKIKGIRGTYYQHKIVLFLRVPIRSFSPCKLQISHVYCG